MAGDLLEALRTVPVVDAHEHVRGHGQCQPQEGVTDFVAGFYLGSLLGYADQALAAQVLDMTRADRQRWRDLLTLWPFVRHTGYGSLVSRMLQAWNVEPDLNEAAFDLVRARIRARSPEGSRRAYEQAGLERSVTHYLAHPCCGGVPNVGDFLQGRLVFETGFHPLLGTTPLHEFFERADLETLGRVCDADLTTVDALVAAIGTLMDKTVRLGVVGFKDHAAYTRGLSFGVADKAAAESELRRLLAGERFERGALRLSDYLFHHIVRRSIDMGLPMAIHTGYLVGSADPKANVSHFASILAAYPEARFDLYHLNYPWFEDMVAILKRFPNTWANCCWTHVIDPGGTTRFLESALGTIPANRIFGFGGDFAGLPEATVAHLEIARENIAAVLEVAVARRWCSRGAALDVARLWLHDNPATFYHIGVG